MPPTVPVLAAVAVLLASAGCGVSGSSAAPDGTLRVVATTEIIADLVREVGGDRVDVGALVPSGGDPHSYEPVPADAARIAAADVAFTNHLLLEPQALVRAVDANLPSGALHVSLAEDAETYGGHVIPLVENLGLDVVWLGLRIRGAPGARGTARGSEIELRATELSGPGALLVYLTGTLGDPTVHVDSRDGLGPADAIRLPPGAHTHVNWAFTRPGVYRLTLAAAVAGEAPAEIGRGTFTFAVGTDPAAVGDAARVVDAGHADLTVDLDSGALYTFLDTDPGPDAAPETLPDAVIDVPDRALVEIPGDARFGFLGAAGERIHQLPQAVIGRHVHGEIDPHLWEDVRNAKAYVQLIRDTLARADAEGAGDYGRRTQDYLARLDELHAYVGETVARIPPERRELVTTHDAFGYLADAYGLRVGGFVVPNPAQEPSAAQVRELTDTIRRLRVPAVFLEPNLAVRAGVLEQVARDAGAAVCRLYGDAFDAEVRSYVAMMRHNADELARCLGGPS